MATIFTRPDLSLAQPISVTDFRGKTIVMQKPAERIVCLIESALSGIFMLDAQNRVIAVSTNVYQKSVYPHYARMDGRIEGKRLPTPGNWDFVNIEMVVGLEPDLVVIWSHQRESIAAMEEKGIAVYGVFIEKFEDIYKEILDLGMLTGREQRARYLVDSAREKIKTLREETLGAKVSRPGPRVYYMWAQGELETSGKNSTVQELIALAGAKNVAGHLPREHLVVNMENVLTWNPEVIVMWYNPRKDPEDILQKPMWRSVSAVVNNRVHEFPDVFSCDLWTLKYIHAVRLVAAWCHPERFKQFDPERQKRMLFKWLYGDKWNPAWRAAGQLLAPQSPGRE